MKKIQSLKSTGSFCRNDIKYRKGAYADKRLGRWFPRNMRTSMFTLFLMGFFLFIHHLVYSPHFDREIQKIISSQKDVKTIQSHEVMNSMVLHPRLLRMASVSLARQKGGSEQNVSFWKETVQASFWKPCSSAQVKRNITNPILNDNETRYILVSANGGLNQQRVAVCNAVAVAAMLNATLVIPKFLYSNVWKDPSQFNDIYQEETFIKVLRDDVHIIKELPAHLRSLNLEAIGSLITDADLSKEATLDEYMKKVVPILSHNGIVHFLGYGNRLGFDPIPYKLQKLRCKCNFHALKFSEKIQKGGSLLLRRLKKYSKRRSMVEEQLLDSNMKHGISLDEASLSAYIALHLRFEVDMVAYSMCDFGGGDKEKLDLQAYREEHFPLLLERLKKTRPLSPTELRRMGRCPLAPEEAALVLAALGFDGNTNIYLAGSEIYGGQSRMQPLISLYPNIITKGNLLSPSELAPFRNFSSQLAALDFIACAASDVFAITDSGSQLSSLVSGFRTYYGEGNAPTVRPNKKRLAAILQESSTINWHTFQERTKK